MRSNIFPLEGFSSKDDSLEEYPEPVKLGDVDLQEEELDEEALEEEELEEEELEEEEVKEEGDL